MASKQSRTCRTFGVSGKIFHWNVQMYQDGIFIKETDHVYRFKVFAQADADHFNKMETIRQKEMNLNYDE